MTDVCRMLERWSVIEPVIRRADCGGRFRPLPLSDYRAAGGLLQSPAPTARCSPRTGTAEQEGDMGLGLLTQEGVGVWR